MQSAREYPGRYPLPATRYPLPADAATASAGARHADLMQAVLRGYGLPSDEQTHALRLLGSVFHGFVTLELAGAFAHSEPASQQSWSRSLDALDSVLRGWPAQLPTAHRR